MNVIEQAQTLFDEGKDSEAMLLLRDAIRNNPRLQYTDDFIRIAQRIAEKHCPTDDKGQAIAPWTHFPGILD
jgi:hypothetical protein